MFRLDDNSGSETYTTRVEASSSKSSTFISSSNSGSDGQLLVAWPERSHKANGGMVLVGMGVGIIITGREVLLFPGFLLVPPALNVFLALVWVVGVCCSCNVVGPFMGWEEFMTDWVLVVVGIERRGLDAKGVDG